MALLPPAVLTIIRVFAPLFTDRVWRRAQGLLIGAILTPGTRTVTAGLRLMGLEQERCFIWTSAIFSTSRAKREGKKIPEPMLVHLIEVLCYAAKWGKSS